MDDPLFLVLFPDSDIPTLVSGAHSVSSLNLDKDAMLSALDYKDFNVYDYFHYNL